jgi:ParB-like chromosome segregation protein Spo0J
MQQPRDHASWPADPVGSGVISDPGGPGRSAVVSVPVLSLRPADSPRLNGEDKAHIARLAETETPLPPILVDRRTMQVIDGMHRLMAASLQGRVSIDVIFFDGSEADVFLQAVQENIAHGLPLSQADRRAAAERIIASHPHMSDRAIGHCVGLAAKTVAAIRKSSSDEIPQSNARLGRDGKVRPLDSGAGRRRAAELLVAQPDASLRDVARAAGISPATVLDVRKRLERGQSPVPGKPPARRGTAAGTGPPDGPARDGTLVQNIPAPRMAPSDPAAAVEKLLRDPSLRNNQRGKEMLRLLHLSAAGAGQLPDAAGDVPPHCVAIIVQLARQFATMWQDFARELDGRARIIDPTTVTRRPAGAGWSASVRPDRGPATPAPGSRQAEAGQESFPEIGEMVSKQGCGLRCPPRGSGLLHTLHS